MILQNRSICKLVYDIWFWLMFFPSHQEFLWTAVNERSNWCDRGNSSLCFLSLTVMAACALQRSKVNSSKSRGLHSEFGALCPCLAAVYMQINTTRHSLATPLATWYVCFWKMQILHIELIRPKWNSEEEEIYFFKLIVFSTINQVLAF